MMKNLLVYEDPLYAIITIDSDGVITIAGRKSSWRGEISPVKIGLKRDLFRSGEELQRAVVPEVRNRRYRVSLKD